MTIPLQFASLYDRQEIFVWSNCLLDLGTDFLIGNRVFVTMYAGTMYTGTKKDRMTLEWTRKGKHTLLSSELHKAEAFGERTFDSSKFLTVGALISASMVYHPMG